jgi:hypothetical protein
VKTRLQPRWQNLPSLAVMTDILQGTDEETVKKVREVLDAARRGSRPNSRQITETLETCDKLLGNYGVEFILAERDVTDFHNCHGLEYSNAGDTYNGTVLYDHDVQRFYVCCWGDIVERDYKRFGASEE